MKNLLLLLILLVSCGNASAQAPDTISYERKLFSANLEYKGRHLSLMKLEDMCINSQDAMDEVRLAKRNNNPALLLTLIGSALVVYSGIKYLTDREVPWAFGGAGIVLIGVSIPLYIGVRNHSYNAARIYNYEVRHRTP